MTRNTKYALISCIAVLLSKGTAHADVSPVQTVTRSAPDPASLAIARQIVAVLIPREQAKAIFDRMLDAIMGPMEAQIRSQIKTDDPGLQAILQDFLNKLPGVVNETMIQKMPQMYDAMAGAYTRMFSRDDLIQILAFAQSSAGSKYLSHSSQVMQDPDVQAYYASVFSAIQRNQVPLMDKFKRKLAAYRAAHPELTKKTAGAETK